MTLVINTLAVIGACTLAWLAWQAAQVAYWKVRWVFLTRQHRREYKAQQRRLAKGIQPIL